MRTKDDVEYVSGPLFYVLSNIGTEGFTIETISNPRPVEITRGKAKSIVVPHFNYPIPFSQTYASREKAVQEIVAHLRNKRHNIERELKNWEKQCGSSQNSTPTSQSASS